MATGTSGKERTIGQLVADATHDLEGIVRGEIALAKAEVTSGAKVIGKGVGMLAGAGFLALMGAVFLLHSAAWGIAEWLPVWAGYLIVAVVILIVAAVLGLLGKKALDNAKPAPERAIEIRDDDVVFFGGCEPEYVTTLEINPVREAKYPRILFRLLWARPFEADMLESVNPSYPRVPVEFSTDTAQESKADNPHRESSTRHILQNGREVKASVNMAFMTGRILGSRRCRMVVGPEVWFLRFVSSPRRSERT